MFGVALVRFLREPDRLHRDVLAVFASFGGLFLISLVLAVWPGAPPILSIAWIVLLYLQPPMTLLLARHFRRQRQWLVPAAFAGMALSLGLVLALDVRTGPGLIIVVGYLVVTDLIAAYEFSQAAASRTGTARARLRSSALATALFALALLLVGLAAAASAAGTPVAGADQVARVLAVLAALGYIAAFLPPRGLLMGLQRAIAFGWLEAILRGRPGAANDVWHALAEAARGITGARGVVVVHDDTVVVATGTPIEPSLVEELLRRDQTAGPTARERWSALRPIGRAQPTAVDGARVIRLDVGTARVRLLLVFEGTPLFVEDDLALIELLGRQATRAIARDQQLRERTALEQQLQLERHRANDEARFRSLLDAQPTALVVAGPDGHVRYANQGAAGLFRAPSAALLGLPIEELVSGVRGVSDAESPVTGDASDGDRPAGAGHAPWILCETVATLRDGSDVPVEIGVSRWSGDQDMLTLVTVSDISDRKAAEVMRERFLDLLSHELRTPVTAIFGGAQLLIARHRRLTEETEREVLDGIAVEADRLQRMVENLITLARVERGVPMGGQDPVLLQRLVPRLVAQEQTQWPAARFEHHLPPGLHTVRGDDDYLGQVLRNLLSNAAKYGGDGIIEVTARDEPDKVTLSVADRGQGFPADEADSLFELYYRSPGVSQHIQGAGIGLFVCRRIVEAMGGRIHARAREGGGSVFEMELPLYVSDDPLADAPAPVTAAAHA